VFSKKGALPKLAVLEKTTLKEWRKRERHWIAKFSRRQLTNGTLGGDGLVDADEAVRKAISEKTAIKLQGNQFRKGIGWITNGDVNQCWPKTEPMPQGFRPGLTGSAKYLRQEIVIRPREITNGLETKKLGPDEPLPEGWFYGRRGKCGPLSEEHKASIGRSNSGKKRPWARKTAKLAHAKVRGSHWITNGTEEQFFKGEDLPEGWRRGRLPSNKPKKPKKPRPKKRKYNGQTKEQRAFHKRMKVMITDLRWITNGTERKRINKNESLPEGWSYLQGSSRWITNGVRNQMILPDQPIPNGWRLGMTKGV